MKSLRKWLRHKDGGGFCLSGNGEESTWGDLYEDPDADRPTFWMQFWILLWAFIWPKPPPAHDLDLVVTRPQGKIDGFTRWVTGYLIPFYEAFLQRRKERKEKKLKRRAQADAEMAASGAINLTPFHESRRRRREKRTKKKAQKIQAKSGNILRPEDWVPKVKREDTIKTWSEKGALRFTSGISTVVACLLPVVAITVLSQVHGTRNLLLCIAGFAVIFAIGLIFLTNGTSSRVDIFTATAA